MTTAISNLCSLDARELEVRIAQWQDLGARALLDSQQTPEGARLTYRQSEDVEREIAALVAAERQCCATGGIGWELERHPDTLTVIISAPEPVRSSPEAKRLLALLTT